MNIKIILLLSVLVLLMACSAPDPKDKGRNDSISGDSIKIVAEDLSHVTSLPRWAKNLGLSEPQHMSLLTELSHHTSVFVQGERFNSVTLVYSGNYDTAMSQAKRIAKVAKLPQSKEYIALKKQASRAGHGKKLKGIAYLNYDLLTRDTNFLIYVQVNEKGILTISATDMKQMNLQLQRHAAKMKSEK